MRLGERLSQNDLIVQNIRAVYCEMRGAIDTGSFDKSLALFDINYLMFDFLQAVGLCSFKNLCKVIGKEEAKDIWKTLI